MWAAMRARNLSGVTRETAQYFTDPRRAFGHGGERTPKGVEATIAASGRSNEQRGRVAIDPGGALDPDWDLGVPAVESREGFAVSLMPPLLW